MSRNIHLLRWAATILMTLAGSAGALAPSIGHAVPRTSSDEQAIQQRLDAVVDAGAVGAWAEVRIGADGWRAVSGSAKLNRQAPIPPNGSFRVGSVTKTFLATVVLQLVDEGRLGLNDSVRKWLPGLIPGGKRIKIKHLLGQTSGIPDYLPTLILPPSPEFLRARFRTWTADQLIARALKQPFVHTSPGSEFSYSSTNYVILGKIVERVTHRSYASAIRTRIVQPLGLRNTSLPGTRVKITGAHAHGYVPILNGDGIDLHDITRMNASVMGAAGEVISTTRDLNKFFRALFQGRLVSKVQLQKMMTPGVENGRYGLGLYLLETSCGVRAYGHDGDALAYNTWSFHDARADHQVTIGVTPNFTGDIDPAIDALLDQALCATRNGPSRYPE